MLIMILDTSRTFYKIISTNKRSKVLIVIVNSIALGPSRPQLFGFHDAELMMPLER